MKTGQQQRHLTLAQYVRRRNGVPLGASGSLRNMLHRSLGAGTFAGFWQYWNPIWGYGLSRYVYSPLVRVMPLTAALIMTFVVSGAIHDLVVSAILGSATFVVTPWFLLLGLGLVFGRAANLDFSGRPWFVRALVNLGYIGLCLALTLIARRIFTFW
jgi:hypothetical protein